MKFLVGLDFSQKPNVLSISANFFTAIFDMNSDLGS